MDKGKPVPELLSPNTRPGSHYVICGHQTQVNAPRLNPSQASWYSFTYPGGMEG